MRPFILILLYYVVAVYAIPSCSRELRKYIDNHESCWANANAVQIIIDQVILKDINFERLPDIIQLKCTIANSTNCYNEIMEPVHSRCNIIPAIQEIRNLYKLITAFNKQVCQDNGTVYVNFLRDGGAQCYKNDNKKRCYEEAQMEGRVSKFGVTSLLDEDICRVLEADWSCLHHYNDCNNLYVKDVYTQILQSMKQQFNCI